MADVFLDANIFLRHLLQDHAEHSPRASDFIERLERGEFRAHTSEAVLFEAVYVLERTHRQPKESIRDSLDTLLSLPNLTLGGKRLFLRALALYVQYNVSLQDAHAVVVMQSLGLTEIVSFDRGFDRIPGITRVEP